MQLLEISPKYYPASDSGKQIVTPLYLRQLEYKYESVINARYELSMFCYCCFMSTLLVFLTLSTMLLSCETMRPTMLTGEAGTILPTLLIGVGP